MNFLLGEKQAGFTQEDVIRLLKAVQEASSFSGRLIVRVDAKSDFKVIKNESGMEIIVPNQKIKQAFQEVII